MNGIGQDFDEFMKEQGLFEEAKEIASKRLVALQLEEEMKKQHISKVAMAKRLNTSRVAVDNVLNVSYNTSLETLERFASVLGKKVQISLI